MAHAIGGAASHIQDRRTAMAAGTFPNTVTACTKRLTRGERYDIEVTQKK